MRGCACNPRPDDDSLPLATLGMKDGVDLGSRLPRKREIDWRELRNPATLCKLLNQCLQDLGIKYELTTEEVENLNVTAVELMLCTMYTGCVRVLTAPCLDRALPLMQAHVRTWACHLRK